MILTGFFYSAIWKNEKNGHTIFRLATNKGKLVCEGKLPKIEYQTPISLDGKFIKRDGENRFIFRSYDFFEDNDNSIQVLNSGAYKKLSEKEKKRVVSYFPYGIFATVEQYQTEEKPMKEFLKSVPLKDKEIAEYVFDRTESFLKQKTLFKEIVSCGGTYANMQKIYNKYHKKSMEILRKNPYKVGLYAKMNFSACDILAKRYGYSTLSEIRADGFFFFAMDMVRSRGNCYATKANLKSACDFLNKNSCYEEKIPFLYVLSRATRHQNIYIHQTSNECHIYYKKIYETECSVAHNIKRINNSSYKLPFQEALMSKLEKDEHIQRSPSQQKSCMVLESTGIKIITGGPGTGKTTTINLIIKYCLENYKDMPVCLCAPTGCAAQHLSEKTGLPASTIHYLIGARPCSSHRNKENDSEDKFLVTNRKLQYKIYIIDEFSMTDLNLTSMLLNLIPNDSLVILVGDADQLPSVDCGNVLNDMISSGFVDVYELTDVFRQSSDSNIIENSRRIKAKEKTLKEGADFSILRVNSSENIRLLTLDYYRNATGEWQILCPTKKYETGSKYLNQVIQNEKHGKYMKQYGENKYFIGDKVMAMKNYEGQFFNGECGNVIDIDEDGMAVRFYNGEEIYFDNLMLEFLVPANAITIHKSQGNEYANILIVIPENAKHMLTVNLLYTAITRAKQNVTLLSENNTIDEILSHPKKEYRNTGLTEMLQKAG